MEEQDYATTYRLEEANWWFAGIRDICIEHVRRGGPATRILDVGCGTGINLESLEVLGPATGVDLSATALRFCQERGRGSLVQATGERLPFPDGSFDVVTAFGVVEHIEADAAAVEEWARVLAPGGRMVILTSAYQWLWSGHDVSNHHARRYRAREVGDLVERAGLRVEQVTYLNTLLGIPIIAVRLLERAWLRGRTPEARKDTGEVPGPVNRLLRGVLQLEGRILRRRRLPFGISILATATKDPVPAAAPATVRSGTSSG